jgi:membrane-associated protease RseP (regulator of RpoE activity)
VSNNGSGHHAAAAAGAGVAETVPEVAVAEKPGPVPEKAVAEKGVGTPDRVPADLGKLFVLLAVAGIGITLSIMNGSFPVVAFVLAIIVMVMLHETAHFVTAKWAGMKVTEYFFGFGPRIWSIRKGETEYGIKSIPVGGYVKIVGMSNMERDIDPVDEPRTYRQQSYPRRMIVAVAGIVTHFVIAFVLLVVLWTAMGVPRYDQPTLTIGSISKLETGASPAIEAGFAVGDRIISVDGKPVNAWEEVPPHIRESGGQPVTFLVDRDGRTISLTAVPAQLAQDDGTSRGFIGIGPSPTVEKVGLVEGVGRAGGDLWGLSVGSVKGLGTFFTPGSLKDYASNLTGKPDSTGAQDNRLVSMVGVVRIAGQAADSGIFNLVWFLIVLNLFVGVFNLVPLLPFDGGHMAIATYERLRSRKGKRYHADVSKMMPVTAAVVVVMLVLGVTSLYLDIVQPVANPFQ